MVTKKQHIIPVVYLKYFSCNPNEERRERKILSINLNSPTYNIEQKKLERVAIKRHFYSIKDDEQPKYNDFVEKNNEQFENNWNRIVEEITNLVDKKCLFYKVQTFQNSELSIELKRSIANFFWRVEARRVEIECFFKFNCINTSKDELESAVKIHHLREMGLMAGRTFLSLCGKKISVFFSKTPIFIASDNPVIAMDGDPHTRSDILNPKSMICCAISPKILVVIAPDYRYKFLYINDLERMLKVDNTENLNIDDIISNKNTFCNTIELRFVDSLQYKENHNSLILIEAKDWLFSNNHNLLKESLYLFPQRSKERPKITNAASIFVPSRIRFFNECLRANS
ncbi:MAG: DUF4238 domain-containing protein [Pleurocapsa minor HA4230-MV1]|jgi:hypothetical protein|nr:DUF4238 domain-containing protein [Pleurocapsa minor HA4230-MV1]